jgi:hypothetical protein
LLDFVKLKLPPNTTKTSSGVIFDKAKTGVLKGFSSVPGFELLPDVETKYVVI